jgi:dTDP-4-dehydrorhamnose reductase
MPTCLITGASGLLGRELSGILSTDYRVVGLAHRQAGPGQRAVDLRDDRALADVLGEIRPDVVIHCAAYRDPDFCEEHPDEARRLNVQPVRVMADRLPPGARLLLISSDYVFDGARPPYREDSPRRPLSVYGQTKVEAEDVVGGRPGGLVVRVGLMIGAGPTLAASGFIAQMRDAVLAARPLALDDVLVRFPTWSRDVARAVQFLLRKEAAGTYHVSGARGATRYAWTMEMAGILGKPGDHLTPSREVVVRAAARPRDAQLATDKIRALGFSGFTDFADVARAVLAAFP